MHKNHKPLTANDLYNIRRDCQVGKGIRQRTIEKLCDEVERLAAESERLAGLRDELLGIAVERAVETGRRLARVHIASEIKRLRRGFPDKTWSEIDREMLGLQTDLEGV